MAEVYRPFVFSPTSGRHRRTPQGPHAGFFFFNVEKLGGACRHDADRIADPALFFLI
jgi:hypothetical protein